MSPKRFLTSGIALFLLTLAPFGGVPAAFASGGTGGHAGGFVRCTSPDSFEPIDLYEGRNEAGLTYRAFDRLNAAELAARLNRIVGAIRPRFLRRELETRLNRIRAAYDSERTFAKPWSAEKSDDSAEIIRSLRLPKNCAFLQAAKFFDYYDQTLDTSLLRSLRPGHSIALFFHEALYKIAVHRRGDPDSRSIRPLVALIFSDFILGAEDGPFDAKSVEKRAAAERKLARLLSELAFAAWGSVESQAQRLPGHLSRMSEASGSIRYWIDREGVVFRNDTPLSKKGEVVRIALAASGTLYGLGTDGAVYRMQSDRLWVKVTSGGYVSHFSVSADGTVYGMGTDGRVYFADPEGRWNPVD